MDEAVGEAVGEAEDRTAGRGVSGGQAAPVGGEASGQVSGVRDGAEPLARVSAGDEPEAKADRARRAWQSSGVHRGEVLIALGVFQRATGEQLWRMLRPHHRHDRITRNALNDLRQGGWVRVESRLPSGHQLWVLTARGHAEAKSMLPANLRGRMPALRRPVPPTSGTGRRPHGGTGSDGHAVAVTSTAAHLVGAGFGLLLSCETKVALKLASSMLYTDLVVRGDDERVPTLLVNVDRGTGSIGDLVAKVRSYTAWWQTPAPTTGPDGHPRDCSVGVLARRHLWPQPYPAAGRQGPPPLVFVFTGATPAQRAARIARLADATAAMHTSLPYGGSATVDRRVPPVLAAELDDLDAHGAGGRVWRRLGRDLLQTLHEALDHPDSDHPDSDHRGEREPTDRVTPRTEYGGKPDGGPWAPPA